MQTFRTSRWARIASTVAVIKNVGTPMSFEPRDRARRVVRVQRAEHQVTRERRLHGDLGRFQIANLAHQDLVRVLPQEWIAECDRTYCRCPASIGTWMIPSMSYSTGSSVVISLSSMLLSSLSAE